MASTQTSPRLAARWSGAALLLVAAALGAPPLPPPAAPRGTADVRLSDIRAWTTGEVTRVALEVSAEVRHTYGLLSNPDRLYVDLHGTRPDSTRGLRYTLPLEVGPIRRVRVALTQPAVTRVVLDLEAAVEHSVSQLANPNRVMIEVRGAGIAPPAPATPPPPPPPAVSLETAPAPRREVRAFVLPQVPARAAAPSMIGEPPYLRTRLDWRAKTMSFAWPEAAPPVKAPPVAAKVVASPAPEPVLQPGREALPAQRNRSGNRSLTRVLGLKMNKVVLDPGHGGHDHGTTGRNGAVEKEVVLDVSIRLGKLIEERLGAEVVFTRTTDTFVSLEDRTRIANEFQADLFLSIHANSSPYRNVSGSETYYLSFTSSKADMDVAARENAGSQSSIHELSEVLRKIAQQDKAEESREFAAMVQASAYELNAQHGASSGKTRNRGVKKAPFAVLIGARMPSILTEIGFVTNSREEALLKTPEYRQKLAEALYKGVEQYAGTLSHFRVASNGTR